MQSEPLNIRHLQASMATQAAITLSICSWVVLAYRVLHPISVNFLIAVILLFNIGLILWHQANRRPQLVALALVTVTFVSAVLAYANLNSFYASGLFIVPILLAAALLGTSHAAMLGLLSCLFLYFATIPAARPALLTGPVALIAVVVAFQLPIVARLRSNLEQEWLDNRKYSTLVQEARIQRGEVSRLNKALNLANSLLQRNVLELAAARVEAEKARQQKEQFAVYVSHELRTPLNIILGFLEVMQRYPETYGDMQWTLTLRSDIAEIQRSARYLSDLVDDLLDLARIDAIKMPIRRELTNLEDVLQEAVDLIGRILKENQVAIHIGVTKSLPLLLIDRTRIRQVVLNLLTNASRFTEQGEIRIHAFFRENEAVISVSDTGTGIPADKLDTLFQDYQQVSLHDATPGRGKGLGLAIAKHFVMMHGGQIWAESQVNQGSTFYFTLPLVAVELGRLTTSSPLHEDLGEPSSTVVVLDSSEYVTAYLRRRLEEYDVVPVADWQAARTFVRERHPHALLFNVPPDAVGSAWGAPPPILAEGIPIIQCSLPVGSWLLEQEIFDDWLIKPIKTGHLLQLMKHHCQHGTRLLLVDDDHSFAQLVRRIIQADGSHYSIHWASTGEDALSQLKTQEFDLILLDIALPGIDGRTVAQMIRAHENLACTPIVAISGLFPGLGVAQAAHSTFAITKAGGFTESELLGLIQDALHQVTPRYENLQIASEPLTTRA